MLAALALVVALASGPLLVVDEHGKPVAGATVTFISASGAREVEHTDASGRATEPGGFPAVSVVVSDPGFLAASLPLASLRGPIVLLRPLPVIGTVTVATGSPASLHQLPLPASLLDGQTIALSGTVSSDRLLRALPGVDFDRSNSAFTNYGQLRAGFSGAGEDRGIVLVDGIPAQDAFGGQIDWQAYPSSTIERAELLRGAGSALYGSGGIGGVLELTTFGPQTGPGAAPSGHVDAGFGTNSALDQGISLRAPFGEKIGASLTAYQSRFSYADLPPAYAAPTDHPAVSSSGSTQARVRYDDGATTLDASALVASDHQDEGRTNYTFDRSYRQEAVRATQRVGPLLASFAYYNRDASIYNLDDLFPTTPGALRYTQHVPTNENGFFSGLSGTLGTTALELRIDQRRVDGQSQQYGPSGATQALGTGVELSQGIALQATFHARRAEALVGLRADRDRYDDLSLLTASAGKPPVTQTVAGHDEGSLSPRAALRYDLTPSLAARIYAGGGFRAPYLNELVRGFQIGKLVEAPNPNLVPERSTSEGAGLDYLIGTRGRLSLDFYQTVVRNAIAFVTLSPTLAMRENVGSTQTNGETLGFQQDLGPCARLRASGTAQYARVTNGPGGTVGKALAYVPDEEATLGIDAGTRGLFSYSVDGSYLGQIYADDREREPLGSALLFSGTVRATLPSGATIALVGDNLTHQTYLSSIDRYGPPLSVAFHIGLPIGPHPERAPGSCSL
ncbi:MAG: TonB-dependent receptor [Vulcanimicrobiaceae bacterium]